DELAAVFGAQCVVLAIDARARTGSAAVNGSPGGGAHLAGGRAPPRPGGGGGRAPPGGGRPPPGRDVVEWAAEAVERGAGEILLTSMDRDGTSHGYDLELTSAVADTVGVPVIASGGAGSLEHLTEAVTAGADAVLCASIFHYGQHT